MSEEVVPKEVKVSTEQQEEKLQDSTKELESIVKCYNYACTRSKKEEIKSSLTVTNLRVIMESKGKRSFERKEIPLQAIYSIETSYFKDNKAWGIIIFALLMAVASIVLAFAFFIYLIFICLPFIALALLYLLKKGEALSMKIYTDKPIHNILSLSYNSRKRIDKELSTAVISVNISPEALDMLKNFGALVFKLQKELLCNRE